MKPLLISFLLITNVIYAQEMPSTFFSNRCEIKIDGTGKSLGIKIKLSMPCEWKQLEGERPHIVKKFSYSSGINTIGSILFIKKLEHSPTKSEINISFSDEGLKDFVEEGCKYISGKKVKIDGVDCGEIISKLTREAPIGTLYVYMLNYYFYFDDKLICLSYSSGSSNDEQAKKIFDQQLSLYRGLAGNTVIISKWE